MENARIALERHPPPVSKPGPLITGNTKTPGGFNTASPVPGRYYTKISTARRNSLLQNGVETPKTPSRVTFYTNPAPADVASTPRISIYGGSVEHTPKRSRLSIPGRLDIQDDKNVLDELPPVVALPFHIADKAWDVATDAAGYSIRTAMSPAVAVYRFFKK